MTLNDVRLKGRQSTTSIHEAGERTISDGRESGKRDGDMMLIEINNPLADKPTTGGSGHGLNNVRQRVAYHYGPRAMVQAGPQDGRFIVSLRLPVEVRHGV